jgi:hypothetical protein
MGLSKGISRKQYHKRSVSDGQDNLFKFKKSAMQKYLLPQSAEQQPFASKNTIQQFTDKDDLGVGSLSAFSKGKGHS